MWSASKSLRFFHIVSRFREYLAVLLKQSGGSNLILQLFWLMIY